ncbi:Maf family nucleotide pyrophosphatase [Paraglaciecola aquimarina]|uniref:7-methyl-GTP pyrophosphatase n=1 Tax=Paraglaciecola algarum TaxID=3050085 RepID=A0ABS9DDG5_9ALTE|nr:nucleoside triphosphate pyrophosphatase [Paraglaciecola sp. G1-23]MCF2950400.1 Maf family nucleotide pyrophosphatase [Paraglaciecola sp. G1-23]
MKITLASSSKYRQNILKKLHLAFDCLAPDIDEAAMETETVEQQVLRLAIKKAKAVALVKPDNYVIGSDQLACFDGQPLGKPGNFAKAKQQLLLINGQTVQFYTGLCIIHKNNQQMEYLVDVFEVKFRQLTEQQISTYLKIEQPYDCAGSFKCESLGISLFKSLNGRDPNSLIGLPLIGLVDLFNQMGINIFEHMQHSLD